MNDLEFLEYLKKIAEKIEKISSLSFDKNSMIVAVDGADHSITFDNETFEVQIGEYGDYFILNKIISDVNIQQVIQVFTQKEFFHKITKLYPKNNIKISDVKDKKKKKKKNTINK